jgi:hypothetical protein
MAAKYWVGFAPQHCDVCASDRMDTFVDGVTRMGPWSNMCLRCFASVGRGLGTGLGQEYKKQKGCESPLYCKLDLKKECSDGCALANLWMKTAG